MRKLVLLLLFVNLHLLAYNQVIKGSVFENGTKNPVLFASIYFNGTFIGTTSD